MTGKQGLEKLLLLYLALGLTVTSLTWVWYFNNLPVKSSDCTTIRGTLRSFSEEGTSKSPLLDFSIQESRARFCVPMDGYRESFDSYAFLANAHTGQELWITARKDELQSAAPLVSTDSATVFVVGLRDNKVVYSTIQGRTKWETYNRQLGLDFAIAFTALTGLYVSGLAFWRIRLVKGRNGCKDQQE